MQYSLVNAQNLVPNPSFEDTNSCPTAFNELFNATGWSSFAGSPDFFHVCNTTDVGVPINFGGVQMAASGNAYAGFVTYAPLPANQNIREFIASQFVSPLIIGTKYFISYKVSLGFNNSSEINCASNKIGVNFTTVSYDQVTPHPLTNNAKFYSTSIISDTVNWNRLTGSFIADSAYNYVVLGNFFEDNYTDTLILNTSISCLSYYYIDDVCISTDSAYTINYIYTGIHHEKLEDNFNIYPNPNNGNFALNYNFGEIGKGKFNVYNSIGQLIYQSKLTQNNGSTNFGLNLASGIYIWSVEADNMIMKKDKFIVVK
jgi:hypothetical protein